MADRYISLKPSDAVHGGAMTPEGIYNITDAKFAAWDYNGAVIPPVPALGIEFKTSDGATYAQYYSAGDAKNVEPTEDGKRLRAKGAITGLNDSTNCFAFMKSLVDSGFSEDKIEHDISVIVGSQVQVVHEQAPEREIGGKKVEKKMIAVIGKVLAMPPEKGEKSEKGKAASTSSSSRPTPVKKANGSEAGDTAIRAKATTVLIDILKGAPGGQLDKKSITRGIYNTMPASDQDRSPILNLCINDPFLSGLTDQHVVYDSDKGVAMYVGD